MSHRGDQSVKARAPARRPIGQLLVDAGALSQSDLLRAAAIRQREDARFGDILLAHGMVDEETLYKAIAAQFDAMVADFVAEPPDVRLIDRLGSDRCLRDGLLPWRQIGGTVVIASCRPEEFHAQREALTTLFGSVRLAVAPETAMHAALLRTRSRTLAANAETRVAEPESCREMDLRLATRRITGLAFVCLAFALAAPRSAAALFTGWAILTLVLASGLRLAAAVAQFRGATRRHQTFETGRKQRRLPTVSIMLPLFKEREIANRLIQRVSRLIYPRELLDILLVVEEDDQVTRDAIAETELPRWIREITVPKGGVKTKPRAMNFALDFCRGSIIGIYDAEDAPDPGQIHKVAAHFAKVGPEVACVQGILDFYNARTNWLSRCFTIEYASWFRVILPGYDRLGLTVPLGGTTLFFRREALEELGGWDAHNVTEDADLGIRLARHGYRTDLIPTVTEEEANCRFWPWVKQRSRWLKGYAMTYAVHMRNPRALWRDLGAWRFFGVQVLFLGTLSQFLLAPLLWSFWSFPLGLPHPLRGVLTNEALTAIGAVFLLSEAITVTTGLVATASDKHKWLWPWVPTLHFYYPLATLAAMKGMWELISKPFYWDKTAHGIHDQGVHLPKTLEETKPTTLKGAYAFGASATPSGLAEAASPFAHDVVQAALNQPLKPLKRGLTFGLNLTEN
ncbi:glycosyltransferase family 2 protein [Celeribacter litoreus]|uniref:glycosyltransferase family 2 protein n=1 Tax=Celeribacter litoreus TaxID=2876714 RepID=UPI001CCDCFAD|nr:glycosyltransferase family 2 protein [Celeribacter litoreus]MCA0043120.1 glycosyltransferase [Celeribacter litoreus]